MNRAFIDNAGTGAPGDIAVGGDHIYWVTGNAIGRANLNGLGVDPAFITGLNSPAGLTANDQYLYWGGASIGRARLDGTDVEPNFMTPSGGADDVAASEQYLYWTSDVGIGRANLDGTGADPKSIDTGVTVTSDSPEGVYPPTELAVNSTRAFWVYSTYHLGNATSDIGRANLDGSGVERVLTGGGLHGSYYGPLGADGSRVFYRVRSGLTDDEIRSFGADAPPPCSPSWTTTADPSVTDPFGGVAVDGGHVYWAHLAEGGLHCSLDATHRKQRQRGRKIQFEVWFEACEEVTHSRLGSSEGRRRALRPQADHCDGRPDGILARRQADTKGPARDPGRAQGRSVGDRAIELRFTDTSGNSSATSYDVRLTRH